MSEQLQAVISVVVIGVLALIGLAVIGPIVGVVTDGSVSDTQQSIEPAVGESVSVSDSTTAEESAVTVRATREHAVYTDGGGYVDADPPDGWDNGSWSVTAVANPDTGESGFLGGDENTAWNPKATHNVVAVDNSSFRIDWDAGQWAAYYNGGSQSAMASVPATADQTSIVVTLNETSDELTISADGSSDTDTLDSAIEQRNASVNWVGMIDEVRFINDELSISQTQTYQSDPIDPLPDADYGARWMFDEGVGETSVAYYNGSDAQLVQAGWTSGVSGPSLSEGTDYELQNDPLAIVVLDGGYLDGAAVVFVNVQHPLAAAVNSVTSGINSAYALIPIVMLVLMAGVVVGVVTRLRS